MARVVAPRKGLGVGPVSSRAAVPVEWPSVASLPAQSAIPSDFGHYESSWDLLSGLDVAELDAMPDEPSAGMPAQRGGEPA